MWSWFPLSAAGCSSTPVNDNQAVFCTDARTLVAQNEMSCTLTLPGIRVQLKCPSERLQGGSLSSACRFFLFYFCVFHVCIRAVWSHWEPLWFLFFLCLYRGADELYTCEARASICCCCLFTAMCPAASPRRKTCVLCQSDGVFLMARSGVGDDSTGFLWSPPPSCLICYTFCFMDAFGWRVINASCFEFVCWGLLWYNLLMWLLDWIKKKMFPLLWLSHCFCGNNRI